MKSTRSGKHRPLRLADKRGGALVVALITLLVVGMIAGTLVTALLAAQRQNRRQHDQAQAQWLAEAGIARGLARLAKKPAYRGETWLAPVRLPEVAEDDPRAAGEVTITVEPAESGPGKLIVVAIYPKHPTQRVLVRREHALGLAAPELPLSPSSGENP
ncbi:MAG: hypothetical protein SFU86_02945 [Pirellulaceae bacterium]|nr:hypothetical protein [Pirellulaceae bacterium]